LCAHADGVLFGEFLQLHNIHQDGAQSTQNATSDLAKKLLYFSMLRVLRRRHWQGLMRPSSTWWNWARFWSAAKASGSVPDIQAWLPMATISSNKAARRRGSRWAAISSSSRIGARPSRR